MHIMCRNIQTIKSKLNATISRGSYKFLSRFHSFNCIYENMILHKHSQSTNIAIINGTLCLICLIYFCRKKHRLRHYGETRENGSSMVRRARYDFTFSNFFLYLSKNSFVLKLLRLMKTFEPCTAISSFVYNSLDFPLGSHYPKTIQISFFV